jgi:hypothetical protein
MLKSYLVSASVDETKKTPLGIYMTIIKAENRDEARKQFLLYAGKRFDYFYIHSIKRQILVSKYDPRKEYKYVDE